MLYRSISRTDAAPMPTAIAFAKIFFASRSRALAVSCLESSTPASARLSGGMTTAQATTGPARGPRPTSSTPAINGPWTRRSSRSTGRQRIRRPAFDLLFRRSRGRHDDAAALLFLDARRLAGQVAQIIQLGATDASA